MNTSLLLSSFYLAGGVVILLFGFVILRENPRNPVNRATALMLFSGALGSILGALAQLLELRGTAAAGATYAGYLRNFAYLWEFFFPSLLYFALVYPVRHRFVRRRQAAEVVIYIPHIFHLGLVLLLGEAARLSNAFDLLLERMGPSGPADLLPTVLGLIDVLISLVNKVHQQLFSLVNLAYAGVALALLYRNWRRVAVGRLRGQLTVVLGGLTVCVGGYVTALLLPIVAPYRDNATIGVFLISVSLIVASAAIAYASVRHRFLDLQNLARRSLLYGATALVFAFLYLVVVKQITRFSAEVFGPNVEVIEAGFIVLSVILFQPLITTVEDLLENLMRSGDRGDVQNVIRDLGRQMAAELDLRGMRERLNANLPRSLLVGSVQLFTVEEGESGRVLDRGDDRVGAAPGSIFAGMLDLLGSAGLPLHRSEIERALRRYEDAETVALHDWIEDLQLLVPLMHQERVRGFLGVGPKLTGGRFHSEDLALLSLLGQQVNTSIENVRLLSENVQKRILEEEISLASAIQRRLLPTTFPEQPGYRTYAVSFASKLVGGDYFDLFSEPDGRLHLAIADVSGKGMAAALLMSSLRAALRSNVAHLRSPALVLARINELLYESTAPENFATFFYGVLDTGRHELVYANAGHNYPILLHADRSAVELKEGGLLLGAFPNAEYVDGRVCVDPGDTLFLYTDGITEATNGGDEDFGEERLHAVLQRWKGMELQEIVDRVLEEVRTFTQGVDPADDVTVLVVRRRGPEMDLEPATPAALEVATHG
jgi:sigma-B regulation protein RsbU (phosphoserine phosphatase)